MRMQNKYSCVSWVLEERSLFLTFSRTYLDFYTGNKVKVVDQEGRFIRNEYEGARNEIVNDVFDVNYYKNETYPGYAQEINSITTRS